jgi:hypothetical protein
LRSAERDVPAATGHEHRPAAGKLILEPPMCDLLVKEDALARAYPTILIDFPQLRIPGA